MSDDVPSYKEIVHKKKPPRLYESVDGVSVQKKLVFRSYGYFFAALLVLSLIVFSYASSVQPGTKYVIDGTWHHAWTLKAGYYNHHQWRMSADDAYLVINATVRGGNNDLNVYVDTPSGRINYGRLTSPIHVVVNVSKYGPGVYTIYLDNGFSLITSKYIDLHEALYKAVPDTSEKDGYVLFAIILAIIGGLGTIGALRRKVIVKVDDDVIELMLGAGLLRRSLYLKVNGFKLDQKITGPLKFRVGKDESRVFAVEPGDWFRQWWLIFVDDKKVGRVP